MATYYKNKNEVKLKRGHTLGYTAGKGYYAAGKPTSPKPSLAPAKTSSEAVPTATRPKAAKTPTAPPHASAPPPTPRGAPPDADAPSRDDTHANRSATSKTPKLSESTDYYIRPGDVPLKPGQLLALTHEHRYYAVGRPNPTRASTTPKSSTAKITAISSRASTESPLKKHVETRDGRTHVTLSHATKPGAERASNDKKMAAHARERSAKPTREPAHKAAVDTRKASSRVHEQLEKNKNRSHHAKSANGIHHLGHNHHGRSAADQPRHRDRYPGPFTTPFELLPPGAPALRPGMKWEASTVFGTPDFIAETSLQASITGVQVQEHAWDLVVTSGNQTLFSLPLGPLNSNLVQSVAAEVGQIRQGLTKTYYVAGAGTVTATWTARGLSVSTSSHEITTDVAIKLPDEIEVSTEGTVHTPGLFTSKPVPVKLAVTTTLTFRPPTRQAPRQRPEPKPTPKLVSTPFPKPAPPFLSVPGLPWAGAGEEGVAPSLNEVVVDVIASLFCDGTSSMSTRRLLRPWNRVS